MAKGSKVLEIKNLSVQFPGGDGQYFNAVKNISFDINKGEVVGFVGESGSGKSSTARAILGLNHHSTGYIKIDGELIPNNPSAIKGRINRWLSSKVQMIFQDAKSSLNPREKVFDVILEGAKNQKLFQKSQESNKVKVGRAWLKNAKVNFSDAYAYQYLAKEVVKINDNQKTKEKYEKGYSILFTAYDDQRVQVQSVKLSAKAKIRWLKTLKKQFLDSGYSLSQIKTTIPAEEFKRLFPKSEKVEFKNSKSLITDFEKVYISKVIKTKFKKDVQEIKNNSKLLLRNEKAKLKIMKSRLKEGKKKLISEREEKLENIIIGWRKTKKELRKKFKTGKSKMLEINAKKDWKEFKAQNTSNIRKRAFYKNVVATAMKKVSISPEHINRYPGEFSGGQAQRIAIARTIAMKSDLIIADEPISALDVSIQAQVINLLKDLIKKEKLTVLFIAHDLQVVRYISDRVIVMYKGELVEEGPSQVLYNNPVHPYTKSLVNSIPSIDHPEKLKNLEPYKPEIVETFLNHNFINKEWFDVAKNHKVYATKEQFKRWTKK